MSKPVGRGPEATGALMRTVRAVVGYLATLGAATRKVTKVTGLGSGMLTAKGKEQLLQGGRSGLNLSCFRGVQWESLVAVQISKS